MRPNGSVAELEARRRQAVRLLGQGLSLHEVARRIGCHPSSVMRWRNRLRAFGEKGLEAKSPPGRPPRLNGGQKRQLLDEVLADLEMDHSIMDVWTTRRIAGVMKIRFGVSFHPDHIGKLMHSLGWSYRRRKRGAADRNEVTCEITKPNGGTIVKEILRGWGPSA